MPKEKSAGAIIFKKEHGVIHYLLLHYAPSEKGRKGHWGFAKGHVEEGETDEQTAEREVFEETGINDLKILPGFKEFEKYFFRKVYGLKGKARQKAPWVFKMVVFFLAETRISDVKISGEHTEFLWLPYEKAVKKINYKNSKALLKKANGFILKNKF